MIDDGASVARPTPHRRGRDYLARVFNPTPARNTGTRTIAGCESGGGQRDSGAVVRQPGWVRQETRAPSPQTRVRPPGGAEARSPTLASSSATRAR